MGGQKSFVGFVGGREIDKTKKGNGEHERTENVGKKPNVEMLGMCGGRKQLAMSVAVSISFSSGSF